MYIKFVDDPDGFIAEIGKDKDAVYRSIVRFAAMIQPINGYDMSNLIAVATARVGSDTLRMEYRCGNLWRNEDLPEPHKRVARIRKQIEEHCEKLGLELRHGIYDTGPSCRIYDVAAQDPI